jgi:SAM-dependent methyltransferase
VPVSCRIDIIEELGYRHCSILRYVPRSRTNVVQREERAMPEAEFDAYSGEYGAGMENPVKALLGESADDFVAIKLRWLLRQFPELRQHDESFRVLDYGCGIGTLLRLMAQAGLRVTLSGCDVSSGMLEEASRQWPASLREPTFYRQGGALVPVPAGSCDLVVISAVLHHVMPAERSAVYSELRRLLRADGRLVVFEHNPLNPVTRYVVGHTPIDQNAMLLRAGEVCAALQEAGFSAVRTGYLMFLPPRLQTLAAVERVLGWLPLGAQYAVTARTP